MHTEPRQLKGGAQSPVCAQLVPQISVVARVGRAVGGRRWRDAEPVAPQVEAGVSVAAAQEAGRQTVPGAKSWQRPPPSHLPFWPQEAGASTRHMPSGSTAPATTFWQVPGFPATLHAVHDAQEAWPQQTPSVQKPLAHSPARRARGALRLEAAAAAMHWLGAMQSPATLQESLQEVASTSQT